VKNNGIVPGKGRAKIKKQHEVIIFLEKVITIVKDWDNRSHKMMYFLQKQHICPATFSNYSADQPDSIDRLFQRVVDDDHSAFEQIFKSTYKTLCAYSNKLVKRHEIAEEIVDDVFFNLWRNRKKIQITNSFHSYLFTSIRNKSLDTLRKLKHERKTVLDGAETIACKQSIAYESLIFEELNARMEAAVSGLPNQCRIIFLMSREQDLKYKEIAVALNISIKTVDTQMGRALRYLRKQLHQSVFNSL
jgi:RNA polymerase sigma-70 factor (ECF subfamily)